METEADDDVGLSRWMLTTLGLSVGLTVLLLGLACRGDDLETLPWRRSDDD